MIINKYTNFGLNSLKKDDVKAKAKAKVMIAYWGTWQEQAEGSL